MKCEHCDKEAVYNIAGPKKTLYFCDDHHKEMITFLNYINELTQGGAKDFIFEDKVYRYYGM